MGKIVRPAADAGTSRLAARIGTATWCATAASAGWAAVRAGGLERGVPGVQLMAFTPYVAAASVVPLTVALATRRWGAALVAAGATATLAAAVLPRALHSADADTRAGADPAGADAGGRAGSEPATGGRLVRVLTANLLHGGADPAALVRLVEQERTDLLAMQEYTEDAEAGLLKAGLDEALPERVAYPAGRGHGSALYSRFPLRDAGRARAATGFGQARAVLAVPDAEPVEVQCVHLSSPADVARTRNWARDLAGQTPADPRGPVRLLLGDFNATLDHAAFRALVASGYRDAASAVGAGLVPTWPYRQWYTPRITLDHVLVDRRIGICGVRAHRLTGSDHRALSAELILPPVDGD